MYPHHAASIDNVAAHFAGDPEVKALLLGGSLAHGFETASSDIDVMIIIADEDYDARRAAARLHYFSRDLCTYPEGYVDGKYQAEGFLPRVAHGGSEPARFAFQDARVLFSHIGDLKPLLERVVRYPQEERTDRIRRFYAQFEAWYWYAGEALRTGNRYLLGVAVSKLVLFGGRMLLAHNGQLYPYHKWFLRVLEGIEDRPKELMARIEAIYESPSGENITSFYSTVKTFRSWEAGNGSWPVQFMADSELNWMEGATPVDDL